MKDVRTIINELAPLDKSVYEGAVRKMDMKTKPKGSLGRLESIALKLCRMQNTLTPKAENKTVFVFASDHGVTDEGVSAFPKEVTSQMVLNFLSGGAAVNVLCRFQSINICVVDVGVDADFDEHKILKQKKVRKSTRNFCKEDAMSEEELYSALNAGVQTFYEENEKRKIYALGLGEMGIGNTTSASAIICAVTGASVAETAGRGTGIDDKKLEHKISVIRKAISERRPIADNGFDVLKKLGGYEIAAMAGAALAAASEGCLILADGVISTAAVLTAYLMNENLVDYVISAHKSVEKSQSAALNFMGLEPHLDLDMRLGEGTGAALAMNFVEAAARIMNEMASFEDAGVSSGD